MIRQGGYAKPTAAGIEVANATQFGTLGGMLMLTVRAAEMQLSTYGAENSATTYEFKVGENTLASGPVPLQKGEELPILWQGEVGPGNLFLTFKGAGSAAAVGNVGYDLTGDLAEPL